MTVIKMSDYLQEKYEKQIVNENTNYGEKFDRIRNTLNRITDLMIEIEHGTKPEPRTPYTSEERRLQMKLCQDKLAKLIGEK